MGEPRRFPQGRCCTHVGKSSSILGDLLVVSTSLGTWVTHNKAILIYHQSDESRFLEQIPASLDLSRTHMPYTRGILKQWFNMRVSIKSWDLQRVYLRWLAGNTDISAPGETYIIIGNNWKEWDQHHPLLDLPIVNMLLLNIILVICSECRNNDSELNVVSQAVGGTPKPLQDTIYCPWWQYIITVKGVSYTT